VDEGDKLFRFAFVDRREGLWTNTNTGTNTINAINTDTINTPYPGESIVCPVGGIVVFTYAQGTHDVVQLPSEAAWNDCDLTTDDPTSDLTDDRVRLLSPSFLPTSLPDVSYYFHCDTPNTTVRCKT
jgi:hypothetical protein